MNRESLIDFLIITNETLAAAIVIITVSILLYNLTRNVYNRVNRASSLLLGSVMLSYLADTFIALEPNLHSLENWFRVQWIGVALVPAALFHLSDALLETTGLVSKGKRRLVTRILYGVGTLFALGALSSDLIIDDLIQKPVVYMSAGVLFPVYLMYFVSASAGAMFNVVRAWKRCLTTYTRRRMTYLMSVFLMPALGVFPYSLVFSVLSSDGGGLPEGWLWLIFNIANLAILAMIVFMAYPLAFFGTYQSDRTIRAKFLEFMLRGPLIGVVVIFVLRIFPRSPDVWGIRGEEILPFAVVGTMLFLHWMTTLLMPYLERFLVYTGDQDQARRLREISENFMTRADSAQLQEAILAAICDQLRVPTAFIASVHPNGNTRLEQVVGYIPDEDGNGTEADTEALLSKAVAESENLSIDTSDISHEGDLFRWQSFWLKPLYVPSSILQNDDTTKATDPQLLLGVIGIWSTKDSFEFEIEEEEVLDLLMLRASYVLMDMRMQSQMLTSLEELMITARTQPKRIANTTTISPYGQLSVSDGTEPFYSTSSPLVAGIEFNEWVKEALRDYWGGPKLSESELLKLNVVHSAAEEDEGNRVRALRRILSEAIESLKPEGQPNLTTTEWLLYNILEMRFLQGRKVKEVSRRLAMSTSDFYRKQRVAIEEVARIIAETELQFTEQTNGKHEESEVLADDDGA